MRVKSIFFVCIIACFLSACSWSNFPFLYKPDIQQGNVLTDDRVSAVQVGMSRDQVNYLLGNPVLTDVISTQETQYVYTFQSGKKPMITRQLKLTFDHDKLMTIEKTPMSNA